MVLQINEAAAAAATVEAWAGAGQDEGDAALGLLHLGEAWRPAASSTPLKWAPPAEHTAPTPPIWERLEALPDPVGGGVPRREWKALERVSVY